jgi:hypothetical protein
MLLSEIVKWIIIISVVVVLIWLFASMMLPLAGLGSQNPFFGALR